MKTLGDRIKEIRKEHNLTQIDFGKLIGIKASSVSWAEKGKQGVSDSVIKSIVNEFCVNEDWLINGIGEKYNYSMKSKKDFLNDELSFISREFLSEQLSFIKSISSIDENKRIEILTSLEEIYKIFNIINPDSPIFLKYVELISGLLFEIERLIQTTVNTPNKVSKNLVTEYVNAISIDLNNIVNLFNEEVLLSINCADIERNVLEDITAKQSQNANLSEEEMYLIKLYRRLTPRDQIKIEAILEEKLHEPLGNKTEEKLSSSQGGEKNRNAG